MSKKRYTSSQVDTVKGMQKDFGWSVRKIAKETGIPKSVVGRWTKEPKVWKERYRFNVPEKVEKKMGKERAKSLDKFRRKIAKGKKKDKGKYVGLQIRYTEDDDWEAYSG